MLISQQTRIAHGVHCILTYIQLMPIFLVMVKIGNIPVPWILRIGGRCSTKWTFFPILGGESVKQLKSQEFFSKHFQVRLSFQGETLRRGKTPQNLDLLVRWLEKNQNIPQMVVTYPMVASVKISPFKQIQTMIQVHNQHIYIYTYVSYMWMLDCPPSQ